MVRLPAVHRQELGVGGHGVLYDPRPLRRGPHCVLDVAVRRSLRRSVQVPRAA